MKKVVSILMIYSVAFMGFATTVPQGVSLNAYSANNTTNFDALPFGTELSADELAQVEGEWRRTVVREVVKRGKQVYKAVRDGATYEGVRRGAKAAAKKLDEPSKHEYNSCRRVCKP